MERAPQMSRQEAEGRKLKVLLVASWYPSEEGRVAGIFSQRHAEAVSRFCDVAGRFACDVVGEKVAGFYQAVCRAAQ